MIAIEKEIYIYVTNLMHVMGAPAHLKGHDFLRTCILDAYYDPNLLKHMMKGLYATVAKKYDTTASCVERDIRAAIETTWKRGNPDTMYMLFKQTVDSERAKPTNKEFIIMMIEIIKMKY